MDFKNIDKKYRPIPFWSWNEKLSTEETERQIDIMDKAGIGGYFMHARGGLETKYMGEEWFRNITVGVEEGKKRNMQAWAYDENGWPSGFGNGSVNANGIDYQQKYLRCEAGEKTNDRTIIQKDGYHFYYDVNPFYVDTLDKKVTECFIKNVYEPYYEKYRDSIEGFFTDEPQISRNGIPWSFILPAEYKNEYGEELLDRLIELFRPVGNFEDTRVKFWKLVTKLFSENFMKTIYDWCVEHNLKLTGHLVLEESLMSQLFSNGACMPHFEYFSMPGMDWLGRDIDYDCLTPLQVSSVAHQLGKKEILSETFALCGHNVSFDELKAVFEWQMVNGITKLCPHLEGYSLRGLRKRDYPPAMYYQQPWWNEFGHFAESMSRIGMILSEGEVKFDTLLLHNQSSAWAVCQGDDYDEEIIKYNKSLRESLHELQRKHIPFHLGDEIIMERHARVEGNELVIGTQRYKTVVIPEHKVLLENTTRLLGEFENGGGLIITSDAIKENDICNNDNLLYTTRDFPDFKIHYFVNKSSETFTSEITKGSKMLDLHSGELLPFYGVYKFHPHESLLVIEDGSPMLDRPFKKALKKLNIDGEWEISGLRENCLTIDYCDVYFDGELVGKKEAAVDVIHMALALKRSVNIKCEYKFFLETIPEEIYLVAETPEKFDIRVNGTLISKESSGYFADKAFIKMSFENLLCEGENIVSLEAQYTPTEELVSNIEKSLQFESEKNKLTFDLEIEPIYVIGNFSVKTEGDFRKLDKDAYRYIGDFKIAAPKDKVNSANIEQQGFPFFAGRLTLKKTFNLSDTGYCISLFKKGVNAVEIKVNGKTKDTLLWEPYECDISQLLVKGDNTIEITLINNLRNLLGPHHLPIGESYSVCPVNFYHKPCVWNQMKENPWEENYCFVEFGFKNSED